MLDLTTHDTIAAVASAPGAASRGVIRVSGPDVARCLSAISSAREQIDVCCLSRVPACFSASLSVEGARQVPAEVLFWPTSASFTRQPAAEIHTFGSPPILDLILLQLFRAGARGARPGEFTLRAFLGGRIDLTQAEAVIAAIDAVDEKNFFQAISQLAGGLANPLTKLRSELLDLLADIEAGLDFVDEDISFVSQETIEQVLFQALADLRQLRAQLEKRQEHRVTPRVVLAGRPNAGKSSLLNRLANQCLAIVSPQAGTTRDCVSTTIQHNDFSIEIVDTAGLTDETIQEDSVVIENRFIDREVQRFASTELQRANLLLCCIDPSDFPSPAELASWLSQPSCTAILVITKSDLKPFVSPCEGVERLTKEFERLSGQDSTFQQRARNAPSSKADLQHQFEVSAATGQGINSLLDRIVQSLTADRTIAEHLLDSGVRCLEAIDRASEALVAANNSAVENHGNEMVATDLRTALDSIGEMTGAVHHDEVLDRLFSRFCIGK